MRSTSVVWSIGLTRGRGRPSVLSHGGLVASVLSHGGLVAAMLVAASAQAADLKVLPSGLGSGTVSSVPAGITCGVDCDETYVMPLVVTLTATPVAGSTFAGWSVDADADLSSTPDCNGAALTCTVTMNVSRSVRPVFNLSPAIPTLTTMVLPAGSAFAPEEIAAYLVANPAVDSPARFVAALPSDFKQSWLLISRSESLQTGTAEFPRIVLPSHTAKAVFTVGVSAHTSYPGAHPNAIEYMQWDGAQKNFRFHEVVLGPIPAMGTIPARVRGVSIDDDKCTKCHSTRNVINASGALGTTGVPAGVVKTKNKPNWDAYDSWTGLLPFNRDRIYQGSVEAAAFRKVLNPWTWRTNPSVRAVIEQLKLQPAGVLPQDLVTRYRGGPSDGTPRFAFDATAPITNEPVPAGSATINTSYNFDGLVGPGPASTVTRGGSKVTLRHVDTPALGTEEGRAVQLFDLLGGLDGDLNQQRIADELASHRWATGSVPIDVRPIALAIEQGCLVIDPAGNTVRSAPGNPALTVDLSFFTSRAGLTINDLFNDTSSRTQTLPRRKADREKLTLDRTGDHYLVSPTNGLIQQYGATTSALTDTSMSRLRSEVFRRPVDLGSPDSTPMGGIYVDRESYGYNTNTVALYRYFLEPLGVSVDKWSMSVRGRSRTYSFADVFGSYAPVFDRDLQASLAVPGDTFPGLPTPVSCSTLIPAVNSSLGSLPPANAVPRYTDVQRIFNKSCIECHGGLGYPPYVNFGSYLDLSENQTPMAPDTALKRSHDLVLPLAASLAGPLYERITRANEDCPYGMMPCGGPPLSKTDIETIRRWIVGGNPATIGDPHLTTIDGVPYDFQSAGEFTLLKDEGMELQARHTPVQTEAPVGPNDHTGLTSCVSITTAVAVKVGPHRITYQPTANGTPESVLELRLDGKIVKQSGAEILLPAGGRIISTSSPGGIQIETPGGTTITITVDWWAYYQVWFMNVDLRHAHATQGIIGSIAPGNWLPALPDGSLLGPLPANLHQRYVDLYEKFEKAWRVTASTSLFDYAPGMSTASFTLESWPEEKPQSCKVVAPPPGIPVKPPPKALPAEVAKQLCSGIADLERRKNCEQDVAATGEPEFAKALALTETQRLNVPPDVAALSSPGDNKTTPSTVSFNWKSTSDKDGDALTYRHCVWQVDTRFTLAACDPKPSTALSRTVAVAGGKAYFWKVIADDGRGGSTESATWRFTAK